jgi:hypothetical protein
MAMVIPVIADLAEQDDWLLREVVMHFPVVHGQFGQFFPWLTIRPARSRFPEFGMIKTSGRSADLMTSSPRTSIST